MVRLQEYFFATATLARLLRETAGRSVDALRLVWKGADVEREEKARQLRAERSDKIPTSTKDRTLDDETISAVTTRINDLHKEIQTLITEPDIERSEKIEGLTEELLQCVDYLDKGTRDKAETERRKPLAAGKLEDTTKQKTVRGHKNRIKELIEQLREARKSNDIRKIAELTGELVNCYNSWSQVMLDMEPIEHRRSRSFGESDSEKSRESG